MIPNPDSERFAAFPSVNSERSSSEIRQYWTPERKRAARPARMFRTGVEQVPESNASPVLSRFDPTSEPKQADLGKMPYTTGGKLFFTLDGVDYVGSGNIFMKKNLVLTAAHCVQDDMTGHLAENFIFERCYSGEESTENFTFKTIALKENWHIEKDNKWDYAIAILDKDSTVETPLKYSIESAFEKRVNAMGYPLNYFDGAQMMYVNGTITQRLDYWTIIGGKLGNGASGGAWVLEDNVTAVGVSSFSTKTSKGGVYMGSPKFDEEFDKLYKYVETLL